MKSKIETRVTIIDMQPTQHEIKKFVEHWKDKVNKVDINHIIHGLARRREKLR